MPADGIDPLPTGPVGWGCSARGCRQTATTDLRWNNPKIHPDTRRKHWLACPEHTDSLSRHLADRGFLRETLPLSDPDPSVPTHPKTANGPAPV